MQFYRLEHDYNTEVVGAVYPQSQKFESLIHLDAPNHLWNQWSKFPNDVYIPDSILHPRAKLTDVISSSPIRHPIVSSKLKQIIEKYRKDGLEFFPANLIVRGKKLQYWLMHGYKMDYRFIDFEKSNLIWVGLGLKKLKEATVKSAHDLETIIETMTVEERIWIEKLVLRDGIEEDIFFLDKVSGSNYYASEKLKSEIEQVDCTGIKFVEYSKSYP